MEKDCYQEIIAEVSNKLAEKFSSTKEFPSQGSDNCAAKLKINYVSQDL